MLGPDILTREGMIMGREFLGIFTDWADSYDSFVEGHDPEYKEVFTGYESILAEVVRRSGKHVLEFGIGTGNLTALLLGAGKNVFAVEPSAQMRQVAARKLGNGFAIHDGDLMSFPQPPKPIDTIVCTFVFHHLTDAEKQEAAFKYAGLLPTGGKIIFADTMFLSPKIHQDTIEKARCQGFHGLADDLGREYYPQITYLKDSFENAGFFVRFSQCNEFAWILEATKK